MATDEERREALVKAMSADPARFWGVTIGVVPERVPEFWADLADALAPLLAEWSAQDRAEALREAADELVTLREVDGRPDWRAGTEECGNWLRNRAAAITHPADRPDQTEPDDGA